MPLLNVDADQLKNKGAELVRNGKVKARRAVGTPESTEPSPTPYWSMALIIGIIALAIKYCDAHGIFFQYFPNTLEWTWFPGFLAAAPMALIFIGLIMGWISVSLDKDVWFRPLAWIVVIVGYWVYGIIAASLVDPVVSVLQGTPIPAPYLYSAASFLIWAIIGMLTLMGTTFVVYRKITFFSANLILGIIILWLASMFLDGFLASASQALLAPIPPEITEQTQNIVTEQMANPNSNLDVLRTFQDFMTTEQGQAIQLLGSLALYWLALALGLQGLRAR